MSARYRVKETRVSSNRSSPGLVAIAQEGNVTERFLTLHPDPGKQGVNINRARYEVVREAITASIQEHGTITFKVLTKSAVKVKTQFE